VNSEILKKIEKLKIINTVISKNFIYTFKKDSIKCSMEKDSEAFYRIGKLLFYGDKNKNININQIEAFKYFELAADLGLTKAQLNVAAAYYYGTEYNNINIRKSIYYYELAADEGNIDAQIQLAILYKGEDIFLKNLYKYFKYLKLAADQGDTDSQHYIGVCYKVGEGCIQNLDEAFKYFKLSADQGHILSKTTFNFLNKFTLDTDNKRKIIETAIQEKSICPITQNILSDVNNIVVTNCKHCFELEGMFLYYHYKKNHAADNIVCPLCKAKL